jgi:DNA-binding transcriptional LysR family regulator
MADRRLQVFHAVAKHLSFTKAADALFMTQPAVTFQIRQLEEQFNTRLFDRASGRISLTPAGMLALEYAERILGMSAELDTRLKELSGHIAGPLHIGASMTIGEYVLPQLIGEFKTRFPAIVPRLLIANSEQVQNRLVERSLDLGFIESDSHLPSLAAEVCCDDELLVVCSPAHLLGKLAAVPPRTLLEHAYVSRESGSGTREVIDRYLEKAGVSLQPVMELGSPEALKGVVATGFGFSIMSRATIALETRLGRVIGVPLLPRIERRFSVVYPKERIHSKLVNGFVEFAKERMAALYTGIRLVSSG